MHTLNVNLVKISSVTDVEITDANRNDIENQILQYVLNETEQYQDEVFDYRLENVGSWKDEYPTVLLGIYDPMRLIEVVKKASQYFYSNALVALKTIKKFTPTISTTIILEKLIEDFRNDASINSDMFLFGIHKIVSSLSGIYQLDSNFININTHLTRLSKAELDDVLTSPAEYALIFLDYHN